MVMASSRSKCYQKKCAGCAVSEVRNVRFKAISQKEFPYSGCWYRIDQNVVLGQCRMSFQPCFNRLHRRLTECNAFLVDFVAELDDRMKPLPGHPLGPLQHSL